MDRSAVDTIRGYCYQFDKSIFEILSLNCDTDSIEVEGVEDVDVSQGGELSAIQCKYYEKSSYNHSVIAKPIRFMLQHFSSNRNADVTYYLYGHYKDGHEKLSDCISVEFLKEKFLSHTKDKIRYEEHVELGLSDDDLKSFIDRLKLDINAKSFDEQNESVIKKIVEIFNCTKEEASHYYYNSAFSVIAKLACDQQNRVITKAEFLRKIDNKKALFNSWLYKFRGRTEYLKKIKSDLFPRSLNTQAYDRFFMIDVSSASNIAEIKECIYTIQKNWASLSKRSPTPYSPYIYLYNQEQCFLHSIKKELYNEGLNFVDGYNYYGSDFCVETLSRAKSDIDIKFQYIETEQDLVQAVNSAKSRVELYQFFTKDNELSIKFDAGIKNTKLQVFEFSDISDLV
ncbi:hypothetical protein DXX93_15140 [Thalassotalea euphylliae]|uniref:DUF4297 domain-containing protein n=1 Tax=Thalassotalea euphylliae TaxID=1655234 RepID=A0A3E0TTK2_9GAMM|nr:DUF4297 family anti-phage-associated protein [Thalassotalea euphylliae]REL27760.1 hypothetical protein DXX93_15140 [Thalassotalea euphylliae]